MKKKEKIESISDNILFLKKSLELLKNDSSEINVEIINESFKKINELEKFFKGIKTIVISGLVSMLITICLLIFLFFYSQKVEKFNNEISDISNDSIAIKILDIKKNKDSTGTTYNYIERNNKIVSYNDLIKENDSLLNSLIIKRKLIDNLNTKADKLSTKVKLAEDNYDISYKHFYKIKKGDTLKYTKINSKKIDSAFILLQIYKGKLIYDKEKNEWYVNE